MFQMTYESRVYYFNDNCFLGSRNGFCLFLLQALYSKKEALWLASSTVFVDLVMRLKKFIISYSVYKLVLGSRLAVNIHFGLNN